MRRTAWAALAVPTVTVLCLGCAGPAVDKQGGARSGGDAVTLQLGAADPGEPSLAYFVDAVNRASGGRLVVDVDQKTYYSETQGGPARLAPDIRDGVVDLAFMPSRDWAAAGDRGFAALQSPFLVTSDAVTIKLATSVVAEDLLHGMASFGVVGLGLVPGEPRRLLTREPVVDQSDLAGARIRVSDSQQTMSLLAALGADPVQGMSAADVRTALADGDLDGVEMSPTYLADNGYDVVAPYLTSFAMIPKFEVLAASSATWGDLSADERNALSSASAETVSWQARHLAGGESSELALLCRNGLVVVAPAASSLEAWRAEAPVPAGGTARRVRQDVTTYVLPYESVDVASDLPGDCPVATSVAQAHSLHREAELETGNSAPPTSGPTIPAGTYREHVTAEQFAAVGLTGSDFAEDITYTWVLRPDGTFLETQDPDYPDQGPEAGHYVVDGYQLLMTYDPSVGGALPPERAHWSYYEGTLTFSQIQVEDPGAAPLYSTPWHKVA